MVSDKVSSEGGLTAQCRSPSGGVVELPVLDVSAAGCLVERRAWSGRANQRILIKLKGLAYQPATVLWVEDDKAGIMFEQMLYEPVLVQLRRSCQPRAAA